MSQIAPALAFAGVASGMVMAMVYSMSAPGPATLIRAQSEAAELKALQKRASEGDKFDTGKKPLRRLKSGDYVYIDDPKLKARGAL